MHGISPELDGSFCDEASPHGASSQKLQLKDVLKDAHEAVLNIGTLGRCFSSY